MLIPIERIEKSIYSLRGQKVMLDRDLAELYGVETRVLNQAVRRNIKRFPDDFMIALSRDEIRDISQFVTSPGFKHAPNVFAFTEQGVAMLSSVLNSDRAIEVNIRIMRTFVKLREMIASNAELARRLDELEQRYDAQFRVVFDAIRQMMQPEEKGRKEIGFKIEEEGAAYV
ncbi:MAG TPA: ORF6N domain-containing protein [Desulfuromonadales bacterium]|nr:ORF6N domain-containing protein [Desulfuromonadales bacterium]